MAPGLRDAGDGLVTTAPVATLLAPRSVAIVGASPREETIGFRIIRNLNRLGFPGSIFPVNPRYPEVADLPCYPSIAKLPEVVDLAFIAVPSANGPALVAEAGAAGVRAVIVNASGYADGGPEGQVLQRELEAAAREHGIALAGPNNMGLINVHDRVGLWTSARLPELEPGPVAIISQSGSVAIALSQDERKLGLAYVITAGNEAVLTVADYLLEVSRDDRVKLVLLFLETLRQPARFTEAVQAAHERGKPILALKVGRSEGGRAAVAAHTGAFSGEDRVYDAFFERHGVLRVHDMDEMVEAASLFTAYPDPPPAPHVVAVTLSGGEAALIADLGADVGVRFPDLAAETRERIRPAFPPFQSPRNPLDAWGLGWDPERFRQIVEGLAADREVRTIAVAIDAPASGGADGPLAAEMARVAVDAARTTDTRLLFFNNAVGNGVNREVASILARAGIPYLAGMRHALVALGYWSKYGEWRRRPPPIPPPDARGERWHATLGGGMPLTEPARFDLLREAGVPMIGCSPVASADEAVAMAVRLGYPVVLKGGGPGVAHKTELGLVRLGLDTPHAVRDAFADVTRRLARHATAGAGVVIQPMLGDGIELIVGVRNDDAFGSILVVGLGGVHVELLREVSLRLGPVDRATASAMLSETRAGTLLDGFRGKGPYDVEAAAEAIAALSRFGAATRGLVAAAEINPLIVRPRGQGALGVDALIEPAARR